MGKEGIGDVYLDQRANSHQNPYRFATRSLTLQRVKIHTDQDLKVGRQGRQLYPVTSSTPLTLTNIDLADLWFKNDADTKTTVTLIGTTKD